MCLTSPGTPAMMDGRRAIQGVTPHRLSAIYIRLAAGCYKVRWRSRFRCYDTCDNASDAMRSNADTVRRRRYFEAVSRYVIGTLRLPSAGQSSTAALLLVVDGDVVVEPGLASDEVDRCYRRPEHKKFAAVVIVSAK